MRNGIRISLITALSVAGISVANAKPLSETIQNIDVSGTVAYRYEDYQNDVSKKGDFTRNKYKIGINASSKISDDFKFNTRIIAGSLGSNDFINLDTSKSDRSLPISLSQVYFSYTGIKNTVLNVGKQGVATPWTRAIHAAGNEQTGTGISGITTWGMLTLQGAYFNQTNLNAADKDVIKKLVNGGSDLYTFGAIVNFGFLKLDAWYLNLSETSPTAGTTNGAGVDTYTLGASSNFNAGALKVGLDARYTDFTITRTNQADRNNSTLDLRAKAKLGIFDAKAVYVNTGKDGGLTTFDIQSKTTYYEWNIASHDKANADLYALGAGIQATNKLHIALNWTTIDYDVIRNSTIVKAQEDEIFTQFTYKVSKNLSTYLRYGQYSVEEGNVKTIEGKYRARFQAVYSF